MAESHTVHWKDLDQAIPPLETDVEHHVNVQREAIPLIFVPGVMGSRLRLAGTDGKGVGAGSDRLPNLRWDPGDAGFMLKNFYEATPLRRKQMLIGEEFNREFLEVHNSAPIGDGLTGIFSDYHPFLSKLKQHDWGALNKIFVFPVYAFGYNWTDSNDRSGALLAKRISEVIDEARGVVGLCEKVILVTHSMGGLVARSACVLHGSQASTLGVIHGVQPVNGSAAGYWRMKAGFEGTGITSDILGNTGPSTTVLLGNSPGGLQLLPNKRYRTNSGQLTWLRVTQGEQTLKALPHVDPYEEIYRVPAKVRPTGNLSPSLNAFWGAIDPELLGPKLDQDTKTDRSNSARSLKALQETLKRSPWDRYLQLLNQAEAFHEGIGDKAHPNTYCFSGIGEATADVAELRVNLRVVRKEPYPLRGFRGLFRDRPDKSGRLGRLAQAVLRKPSGEGDGTVPVSSARALNRKGKAVSGEHPGDGEFPVEHQAAYEDEAVQEYTVRAIHALCKQHYQDKRP